MEKKHCCDPTHSHPMQCAMQMTNYSLARNINGEGLLDEPSRAVSERIFEISTEDIDKLQCSVLKLRTLMTRLRRCMPENTIAYAGVESKWAKSDWELYKKIYCNDWKYYNSLFHDRWVLALIDTFIDWGDPIESKNAMITSLFIRYERIAGTEAWSCRDILNNRTDFDMSKLKCRNRAEIWPSIITTNMPQDDYYINLFRRHMFVLKDSPMFKDIFVRFVKHAMASNKSLISVICKASPWVKGHITKILEE